MPLSTVYIRFAAQAPLPRRMPLLERLLARAAAWQPVADWRLEALRVIAPQATAVPSPAVMLMRSMPSNPADGRIDAGPWPWACMAAPVHLDAGMSSLTLQAHGILSLAAAESAVLAEDFNRVFAGEGARLEAAWGWLICRWDRTLEATTHDPATAAGGDLYDHQPSGPDGGRLRRLASAVEMWLFDHPLNRARVKAGAPAINGLWFWGGGRSEEPAPALTGWSAGDDPLFAALGRMTGDGGPAWRGPAAPGVGVCAAPPGEDAWHEAERRWLEPALAALRAGRLARLQLSAGSVRCTVTRGFELKFWRRARPWWEWFDAAA